MFGIKFDEAEFKQDTEKMKKEGTVALQGAADTMAKLLKTTGEKLEQVVKESRERMAKEEAEKKDPPLR